MKEIIGFFLSVTGGFVPMFLLAMVIYWLDRYEKEPKRLLGGVFGWGAIVAVMGALVLQVMLGQGVLLITGSEAVEQALGTSIFAPVTEECLKGLAILLIFGLFHSEFDSLLDGIVYAAVTALGFAATEDVFYYFAAYEAGGWSSLAGTFFLRFVVFGWQHAFFTSFTGIGLAVARSTTRKTVRFSAPCLGLLAAIGLHALHNSLLSLISGMTGVVAAAVVAWTGWLLMLIFIFTLILREKNWLTFYLREEVDAQVITLQQYRVACSLFGQSIARVSAALRGKYQVTARFYQLCGELSHKKRQLATLGEETGNRETVEALRFELSQLSGWLA